MRAIDWHELIPAYALGTLEPEEATKLEQQLRMDGSLRAEFELYRAAVGALPFAVEPVAPPAHVKAALLAKIAAPAVQPATRRSLQPLRSRRWTFALGGAFAAALLAVALLGGALFTAQSQLQQARDNSQIMAAQVADMQKQATTTAQMLTDVQRAQQQLNDDLATARANEQRLAANAAASAAELRTIKSEIATNQNTLTFLAAGDLATRPLQAAASQTDAQGSMFMRPGHTDAVVLVRGLERLEQSQTYQFWLAQDGRQVNAGTLVIEADGTGRLLLNAPAPVDTFSQIMVTVEQNSQTTLPSTNVVLQGSLS